MGHGFTVLRLPPYHCDLNPIELVWNLVKQNIESKNAGSISLPVLKQMTAQSISEISKEDWIKCCHSVKHIEDEYWCCDALMEEEVERIVINIGIVSSDEECDEDEMDYDRPGRGTDTADKGSSTDSADEIETSASDIQLLLE
ncbi:hypothetical protein ANN_19283 [Periplaneta americana]|uniref:Tc1-like transposase DDE domain-containing protein n=1 Tax=Periplaneta americana TaxID=6978 RepID=A0ABQ8S9F3_PERAM|nr:hypothetical protein ANN_19283 [Periplaneta americana]